MTTLLWHYLRQNPTKPLASWTRAPRQYVWLPLLKNHTSRHKTGWFNFLSLPFKATSHFFPAVHILVKNAKSHHFSCHQFEPYYLFRPIPYYYASSWSWNFFFHYLLLLLLSPLLFSTTPPCVSISCSKYLLSSQDSFLKQRLRFSIAIYTKQRKNILN